MKYSIKNIDFLKITLKDGSEKKYSYGLSQEWYKHFIQVLAGCGATVAATIYIYELQKNNYKQYDEKNCLIFMEILWEYLTPGFRGLNSTKMFTNGFSSFLKDNNLSYECKLLDLSPKNKKEFNEVVDFIKSSLEDDIPIAFLNLCNGEEKNLDKWHWVTIISLIIENDNYFVEILDDTEIKKIDIKMWYKTFKNNGGLISFKIKS